jgi:hypothetical protein
MIFSTLPQLMFLPQGGSTLFINIQIKSINYSSVYFKLQIFGEEECIYVFGGKARRKETARKTKT